MIGTELPPGFAALIALGDSGGSLRVGVRQHPACLWIVASGYIGMSLLRKELAVADEFGNTQTAGWSYVVDTRAVWGFNTLNVFLLRRILRMPNIRRYVVIAPRWMRTLARAGRLIVRPTAMVETPEEALTLTAEPADGKGDTENG